MFFFAGYPTISSLKYDSKSGVLTCESAGGPATLVTWNRTGPSYKQSQRIMNTSTAIYYNYLHINSSELMDYYGIFCCSVKNIRGNDTATITLNNAGISFMYLVSHLNLGMILLESYYNNSWTLVISFIMRSYKNHLAPCT